MKKVYLFVLSIAFVLTACKSNKYADLGDGVFADIKTNKGDITVKLEYEKTPVTVANFVSLANGTNTFVKEEFKGKKYYDGLTFHRVMKGFVIQGGDPTASGSGGQGYMFKDEFTDSLKHDKIGILSMANPGPPNTNGSQFFITDTIASFLDGRHTVFGEVVLGMDVLDLITEVEVSPGNNKPVADVIMNTVEIIKNGKEAKNFVANDVMTDYFAEEQAKVEAFNKMKAEVSAEFLAQKETATELPSGLRILKINEGTGVKPKLDQYVMVSYAGYLITGSLFDSNYEEVATKFNMFDERRKQGRGYEPTPMLYSAEAQLIQGFREGLLTMRVGDKLRLFIPSHLGYGAQGGGRGAIPPNADLVFDIEITGLQ